MGTPRSPRNGSVGARSPGPGSCPWEETCHRQPALVSGRIANITSETHPIHLHLSDFQVLGRQDLDAKGYEAALMRFREGVGPEPSLDDFLDGDMEPAEKYERGNKDTVQAHGESVTTIVVKFGEFTGDAVWHCHILGHEDNDMMRPLRVVP